MPDPGPSTWANNMMSGGNGELADARAKRDLMRANLQAIRRGKTKVSRTRLRQLEKQLEALEAEVTRLETAQAPRVREPVAGPFTGPGPPAPSPGIGPSGGMGLPPSAAGGSMGNWVRGRAASYRPTRLPQAGAPSVPPMGVPGSQIGRPRPQLQKQMWGQGLAETGMPPGAGALGGAAKDPWDMTPEEMWQYQNRMTPYQQAQIAQGQATAGATAAWRQQQLAQDKELLKLQLQQAWQETQAKLAQAQADMAANIGIRSSELQGQMWGQGLPYALPRGTSVAPGFEHGGPAQQLYRMSGAQFTPGRTGRISPQPQPGMGQIQKWVSEAMQKYGPGG